MMKRLIVWAAVVSTLILNVSSTDAGKYADKTTGQLTVNGRNLGTQWHGNAPYFGKTYRGRLAYEVAGKSTKLTFLDKESKDLDTRWTFIILERKTTDTKLPPLPGDSFPGKRTEQRVKFLLQASEGEHRNWYVAVDDKSEFHLTEQRKDAATLELFTGYSYWSTSK